jgi:ABC-type phosphate transport system substrate-binding protein
MNRRTLLLTTALLLALPAVLRPAPASADGEEIAVIVNKGNGVPPMSRGQLSALFKAKSTQFPSGARATAVNLPPENATRQTFDYVVLGMKPDEVERYWLDSKIRSGVGSPRKLAGPQAVVHFVSSDETGIGYVPKGEANASVRVVAVVRGGQVVPP